MQRMKPIIPERRAWVTACVSLLIASVPASPSQAEDAASVFESLYGDRMRAAASSISREDDLALAGQLIEAGKAKDVPEPLRVVLLDNAHQLATKTPDGYELGVTALTVMAELVPDRRDEANEKSIALLTRLSRTARGDERESVSRRLAQLLVTVGTDYAEQKKYDTAGDHFRKAMMFAAATEREALKWRTAWALHMSRSLRTATQLEESLLSSADAATAEKLIRIHLIDFDAPAIVTKWTDRATDASLIAVARLADKEIESLDAGQCLQLAQWYRDAAASAAEYVRPPLYARAIPLARRGLALQSADDLARTKAALLLQDMLAIEKSAGPLMVRQPERTAVAESRGEKWQSILPLLDMQKDVTVGKLKWDRKALVCDNKDSFRLVLPWEPSGGYRIRYALQFDNRDTCAVTMFLPVGSRMTFMGIDAWPGRGALHTGIEMINGHAGYSNATTTKGQQLTKGKLHHLEIAVTCEDGKATFHLDIDRKPLIRWSGNEKNLSLWNGFTDIDRRRPALVISGPVRIEALDVQAADGAVKVSRSQN